LRLVGRGACDDDLGGEARQTGGLGAGERERSKDWRTASEPCRYFRNDRRQASGSDRSCRCHWRDGRYGRKCTFGRGYGDVDASRSSLDPAPRSAVLELRDAS